MSLSETFSLYLAHKDLFLGCCCNFCLPDDDRSLTSMVQPTRSDGYVLLDLLVPFQSVTDGTLDLYVDTGIALKPQIYCI